MNTSYGPPCPEGLQREQKGGGLRPRLALPFIGSRSLEQPPHFVSVTAYVEMSPSPIGSHTSGTLICDGGFAVSPPQALGGELWKKFLSQCCTWGILLLPTHALNVSFFLDLSLYLRLLLLLDPAESGKAVCMGN